MNNLVGFVFVGFSIFIGLGISDITLCFIWLSFGLSVLIWRYVWICLWICKTITWCPHLTSRPFPRKLGSEDTVLWFLSVKQQHGRRVSKLKDSGWEVGWHQFWKHPIRKSHLFYVNVHCLDISMGLSYVRYSYVVY